MCPEACAQNTNILLWMRMRWSESHGCWWWRWNAQNGYYLHSIPKIQCITSTPIITVCFYILILWYISGTYRITLYWNIPLLWYILLNWYSCTHFFACSVWSEKLYSNDSHASSSLSLSILVLTPSNLNYTLDQMLYFQVISTHIFPILLVMEIYLYVLLQYIYYNIKNNHRAFIPGHLCMSPKLCKDLVYKHFSIMTWQEYLYYLWCPCISRWVFFLQYKPIPIHIKCV